MAGPYDYTIQQPDIAGSLLGGLQAGSQIGAQQAAQQKHQQYADDLQSYLQNPTARAASAMMAKYPESQKALAASFDIYDKGQKEDIFKAGTQAYSAIQNGRPEIAMNILDDRIKAAENSGQDTADLISLKESLQRDPNGAGAGLALTMSALNPDGWSKIASEQRAAEKAPAELSLAESKAGKAAVDAKFAESKAVQDLEKGGWEINKLANDIGISKLNSQIAAMNAATSREGNDLKRQELSLKLQEKIDKRDDAIRSQVAKIENVRGTIDNSLSTIDRVLKNPALDSVLGAVEGSSLYPSTLVGLLPGTASADDRANAIADIDTLKSQTFLNQLQAMKEASTTGASGLGGLTEKEGEKLVNGVQSLNTKQGEKQYKENLSEIQRLLLKNRDNLAKKYGVPDTIPDRPNLQSQPPSSGFKVLGVE
jgi:hypothetical protein